MKKITAVIIAWCFLYTGVLHQSVYAAVGLVHAAGSSGSAAFPVDAARPVSGFRGGAGPLFVIIQDLHCNGEAQRGIARSLSWLDAHAGLGRIYMEGASGRVDPAWLSGMNASARGREMLEGLVDTGRLTGAEYFAARSTAPKELIGMEDEALYAANFVRLGRLMAGQEGREPILLGMRSRLNELQVPCFSPANKRLDHMRAERQAGRMPPERYYRQLARIISDTNRIARTDDNCAAIALENYPSLHAYMELLGGRLRADPRRAGTQLKNLLGVLRTRISYSAYHALVAGLNDPSGLAALKDSLSSLAPELERMIPRAYPDLDGMMRRARLSLGIDPEALLREERMLIQELRIAQSADAGEAQLCFLDGHIGLLEDLLANRISSEEFAVYERGRERFDSLWAARVGGSALDALAQDRAIAREYARGNIARNEGFARNIAELAGPGASAVPADPSALLAGSASAIAIVAGGFHAEGLARILRERGRSFVVLVPQVRCGTEGSARLYRELARAQARAERSAFALRPLSRQSFEERLFAFLGVAFKQGRIAAAERSLGAVLRDLLPGDRRNLNEPHIRGTLTEVIHLWNSQPGVPDEMRGLEAGGIETLPDGFRFTLRFASGRSIAFRLAPDGSVHMDFAGNALRESRVSAASAIQRGSAWARDLLKAHPALRVWLTDVFLVPVYEFGEFFQPFRFYRRHAVLNTSFAARASRIFGMVFIWSAMAAAVFWLPQIVAGGWLGLTPGIAYFLVALPVVFAAIPVAYYLAHALYNAVFRWAPLALPGMPAGGDHQVRSISFGSISGYESWMNSIGEQERAALDSRFGKSFALCIRSVMSHLIENAYDAVAVRAGREKANYAAKVSYTVLILPDGKVRAVLEDNGDGMSPERLEAYMQIEESARAWNGEPLFGGRGKGARFAFLHGILMFADHYPSVLTVETMDGTTSSAKVVGSDGTFRPVQGSRAVPGTRITLEIDPGLDVRSTDGSAAVLLDETWERRLRYSGPVSVAVVPAAAVSGMSGLDVTISDTLGADEYRIRNHAQLVQLLRLCGVRTHIMHDQVYARFDGREVPLAMNDAAELRRVLSAGLGIRGGQIGLPGESGMAGRDGADGASGQSLTHPKINEFWVRVFGFFGWRPARNSDGESRMSQVIRLISAPFLTLPFYLAFSPLAAGVDETRPMRPAEKRGRFALSLAVSVGMALGGLWLGGNNLTLLAAAALMPVDIMVHTVQLAVGKTDDETAAQYRSRKFGAAAVWLGTAGTILVLALPGCVPPGWIIAGAYFVNAVIHAGYNVLFPWAALSPPGPLPLLKARFLSGDLAQEGIAILRGTPAGRGLSLDDMCRLNPRLSCTDLAFLPLLDGVPRGILSGEDWGIAEVGSDGIIFFSGRIRELVLFRESEAPLIRGFFEEFVSHAGLGAEDAFCRLFSRADIDDLLLSSEASLHLGHVRSEMLFFPGEDLHYYSDMTFMTMMALQSVETLPANILAKKERRQWAWVAREDGIEFIDLESEEQTLVPYNDRMLGYFAQARVRLSRLIGFFRAQAPAAMSRSVNLLDRMALHNRRGISTGYDQARAELFDQLRWLSPVIQDDLLVSAGAAVQISPRFMPDELRLITRTLRVVPRHLTETAPGRLSCLRGGGIAGSWSHDPETQYTRYLIPFSSGPPDILPWDAEQLKELSGYLPGAGTPEMSDLSRQYALLQAFGESLWMDVPAAARPRLAIALLHLPSSGLPAGAPGDPARFGRAFAGYVLFGAYLRASASEGPGPSMVYEYLRNEVFKGREYGPEVHAAMRNVPGQEQAQDIKALIGIITGSVEKFATPQGQTKWIIAGDMVGMLTGSLKQAASAVARMALRRVAIADPGLFGFIVTRGPAIGLPEPGAYLIEMYDDLMAGERPEAALRLTQAMVRALHSIPSTDAGFLKVLSQRVLRDMGRECAGPPSVMAARVPAVVRKEEFFERADQEGQLYFKQEYHEHLPYIPSPFAVLRMKALYQAAHYRREALEGIARAVLALDHRQSGMRDALFELAQDPRQTASLRLAAAKSLLVNEYDELVKAARVQSRTSVQQTMDDAQKTALARVIVTIYHSYEPRVVRGQALELLKEYLPVVISAGSYRILFNDLVMAGLGAASAQSRRDRSYMKDAEALADIMSMLLGSPPQAGLPVEGAIDEVVRALIARQWNSDINSEVSSHLAGVIPRRDPAVIDFFLGRLKKTSRSPVLSRAVLTANQLEPARAARELAGLVSGASGPDDTGPRAGYMLLLAHQHDQTLMTALALDQCFLEGTGPAVDARYRLYAGMLAISLLEDITGGIIDRPLYDRIVASLKPVAGKYLADFASGSAGESLPSMFDTIWLQDEEAKPAAMACALALEGFSGDLRVSHAHIAGLITDCRDLILRPYFDNADSRLHFGGAFHRDQSRSFFVGVVLHEMAHMLSFSRGYFPGYDLRFSIFGEMVGDITSYMVLDHLNIKDAALDTHLDYEGAQRLVERHGQAVQEPHHGARAFLMALMQAHRQLAHDGYPVSPEVDWARLLTAVLDMLEVLRRTGDSGQGFHEMTIDVLARYFNITPLEAERYIRETELGSVYNDFAPETDQELPDIVQIAPPSDVMLEMATQAAMVQAARLGDAARPAASALGRDDDLASAAYRWEWVFLLGPISLLKNIPWFTAWVARIIGVNAPPPQEIRARLTLSPGRQAFDIATWLGGLALGIVSVIFVSAGAAQILALAAGAVVFAAGRAAVFAMAHQWASPAERRTIGKLGFQWTLLSILPGALGFGILATLGLPLYGLIAVGAALPAAGTFFAVRQHQQHNAGDQPPASAMRSQSSSPDDHLITLFGSKSEASAQKRIADAGLDAGEVARELLRIAGDRTQSSTIREEIIFALGEIASPDMLSSIAQLATEDDLIIQQAVISVIKARLSRDGMPDQVVGFLAKVLKVAAKLMSFSFDRGGLAAYNWEALSSTIMNDESIEFLPLPTGIEFPDPAPRKQANEPSEFQSPEEMLSALGITDAEYVTTWGRKLIYKVKQSEGGYDYVSIKMMRADETPDVLVRERNNLEFLHQLQNSSAISEQHRLQGKYAVPLGQPESIFRVRVQDERSRTRTGEPIKVAVSERGYTTAIVLRESRETLIYLDGGMNEESTGDVRRDELIGALHPVINQAEFDSAAFLALDDLNRLALFGIVHPNLIALFHSVPMDTDRPHDAGFWSWEAFGHLTRPLDAAALSNIRLGGAADFADLARISDIANDRSPMYQRLDASGRSSQHLFRHFIGEYRFALLLVRLRWLHDTMPNKLNANTAEDELASFARAMAERSLLVVCGATQPQLQEILSIVDWKLMAHQLLYYSFGRFPQDLGLAAKAISRGGKDGAAIGRIRRALSPRPEIILPDYDELTHDMGISIDENGDWWGWPGDVRNRDWGAAQAKSPVTEVHKELFLIGSITVLMLSRLQRSLHTHGSPFAADRTGRQAVGLGKGIIPSLRRIFVDRLGLDPGLYDNAVGPAIEEAFFSGLQVLALIGIPDYYVVASIAVRMVFVALHLFGARAPADIDKSHAQIILERGLIPLLVSLCLGIPLPAVVASIPAAAIYSSAAGIFYAMAVHMTFNAVITHLLNRLARIPRVNAWLERMGLPGLRLGKAIIGGGGMPASPAQHVQALLNQMRYRALTMYGMLRPGRVEFNIQSHRSLQADEDPAAGSTDEFAVPAACSGACPWCMIGVQIWGLRGDEQHERLPLDLAGIRRYIQSSNLLSAGVWLSGEDTLDDEQAFWAALEADLASRGPNGRAPRFITNGLFFLGPDGGQSERFFSRLRSSAGGDNAYIMMSWDSMKVEQYARQLGLSEQEIIRRMARTIVLFEDHFRGTITLFEHDQNAQEPAVIHLFHARLNEAVRAARSEKGAAPIPAGAAGKSGLTDDEAAAMHGYRIRFNPIAYLNDQAVRWGLRHGRLGANDFIPVGQIMEQAAWPGLEFDLSLDFASGYPATMWFTYAFPFIGRMPILPEELTLTKLQYMFANDPWVRRFHFRGRLKDIAEFAVALEPGLLKQSAVTPEQLVNHVSSNRILLQQTGLLIVLDDILHGDPIAHLPPGLAGYLLDPDLLAAYQRYAGRRLSIPGAETDQLWRDIAGPIVAAGPAGIADLAGFLRNDVFAQFSRDGKFGKEMDPAQIVPLTLGNAHLKPLPMPRGSAADDEDAPQMTAAAMHQRTYEIAKTNGLPAGAATGAAPAGFERVSGSGILMSEAMGSMNADGTSWIPGELDRIIPGWPAVRERLVRARQGHNGDDFYEHTRKAVLNVDAAAGMLVDHGVLAAPPDPAFLRKARRIMLLHDCAKQEAGGDRHEEASAVLARETLADMGYSPSERDEVFDIIRLHSTPLNMREFDEKLNEIQRAGSLNVDLLLMVWLCDVIGRDYLGEQWNIQRIIRMAEALRLAREGRLSGAQRERLEAMFHNFSVMHALAGAGRISDPRYPTGKEFHIACFAEYGNRLYEDDLADDLRVRYQQRYPQFLNDPRPAAAVPPATYGDIVPEAAGMTGAAAEGAVAPAANAVPPTGAPIISEQRIRQLCALCGITSFGYLLAKVRARRAAAVGTGGAQDPGEDQYYFRRWMRAELVRGFITVQVPVTGRMLNTRTRLLRRTDEEGRYEKERNGRAAEFKRMFKRGENDRIRALPGQWGPRRTAQAVADYLYGSQGAVPAGLGPMLRLALDDQTRTALWLELWDYLISPPDALPAKDEYALSAKMLEVLPDLAELDPVLGREILRRLVADANEFAEHISGVAFSEHAGMRFGFAADILSRNIFEPRYEFITEYLLSDSGLTPVARKAFLEWISRSMNVLIVSGADDARRFGAFGARLLLGDVKEHTALHAQIGPLVVDMARKHRPVPLPGRENLALALYADAMFQSRARRLLADQGASDSPASLFSLARASARLVDRFDREPTLAAAIAAAGLVIDAVRANGSRQLIARGSTIAQILNHQAVFTVNGLQGLLSDLGLRPGLPVSANGVTLIGLRVVPGNALRDSIRTVLRHLLAARRPVLWVAAHGSPGKISFSDELSISPDELADLLIEAWPGPGKPDFASLVIIGETCMSYQYKRAFLNRLTARGVAGIPFVVMSSNENEKTVVDRFPNAVRASVDPRQKALLVRDLLAADGAAEYQDMGFFLPLGEQEYAAVAGAMRALPPRSMPRPADLPAQEDPALPGIDVLADDPGNAVQPGGRLSPEARALELFIRPRESAVALGVTAAMGMALAGGLRMIDLPGGLTLIAYVPALLLGMLWIAGIAGSAVSRWFTDAAGSRAGPMLEIGSLRFESIPGTALFAAMPRRGVIAVNPLAYRLLARLPRWTSILLLHAAGIIGHEHAHLRGRGEAFAYGVYQILPALVGSLLFGSLAVLAAMPVAGVCVVALCGAIVVTGLFSITSISTMPLTAGAWVSHMRAVWMPWKDGIAWLRSASVVVMAQAASARGMLRAMGFAERRPGLAGKTIYHIASDGSANDAALEGMARQGASVIAVAAYPPGGIPGAAEFVSLAVGRGTITVYRAYDQVRDRQWYYLAIPEGLEDGEAVFNRTALAFIAELSGNRLTARRAGAGRGAWALDPARRGYQPAAILCGNAGQAQALYAELRASTDRARGESDPKAAWMFKILYAAPLLTTDLFAEKTPDQALDLLAAAMRERRAEAVARADGRSLEMTAGEFSGLSQTDIFNLGKALRIAGIVRVTVIVGPAVPGDAVRLEENLAHLRRYCRGVEAILRVAPGAEPARLPFDRLEIDLSGSLWPQSGQLRAWLNGLSERFPDALIALRAGDCADAQRILPGIRSSLNANIDMDGWWPRGISLNSVAPQEYTGTNYLRESPNEFISRLHMNVISLIWADPQSPDSVYQTAVRADPADLPGMEAITALLGDEAVHAFLGGADLPSDKAAFVCGMIPGDQIAFARRLRVLFTAYAGDRNAETAALARGCLRGVAENALAQEYLRVDREKSMRLGFVRPADRRMMGEMLLAERIAARGAAQNQSARVVAVVARMKAVSPSLGVDQYQAQADRAIMELYNLRSEPGAVAALIQLLDLYGERIRELPRESYRPVLDASGVSAILGAA